VTRRPETNPRGGVAGDHRAASGVASRGTASDPRSRTELGEPETERVSAVIESRMLADGDEVREFEQEFAEFCGVKRGVATSNGTTALHAALEALETATATRSHHTVFVHRDGERDQT